MSVPGADPLDITQVAASGPGDAPLTPAARLADTVPGDEQPLARSPGGALRSLAERGKIGRFLVLRELGRGAMGVVYAGYDEELDRKVAIKLLHLGDDGAGSRGRLALLREAQALARLADPHVVTVHEVGVVDGAVYLAMEYVAGVDLQVWLTAEPRPWRAIADVMGQAGAGLRAAHRVDVIHSDFKPSNVLVGEDGRVRVADFGLATRRVAGDGPLPDDSQARLDHGGALIGTPAYMAPELFHGAPATARSDQYAFCVALYEALYGAPPIEADSLPALILATRSVTLPTTPLRPEVPLSLHAAILRGLSRAPEDRFPDLEPLLAALARDPEAERRQLRQRATQIVATIAATAALVVALIVGVGLARREMAEQQAATRLAAFSAELASLHARGEHDDAARSLRTFVELPDNRGSAVISRAYLEWAAAQDDHAAAVDASASAYVAARTVDDERAALQQLIHHLTAQDALAEASAALAVLDSEAPVDAADAPLSAARLAVALHRRDLPAARAALTAAGDPDGWLPVLGDMSMVREFSCAQLGVPEPARAEIDVVDLDGDRRPELIVHAHGLGSGTVRVLRAEPSLTLWRTLRLGPDAHNVVALATVGDGAMRLLASHRAGAGTEVRLHEVEPGGGTRTLELWADSPNLTAVAVDLAGDGHPEIYVGTGAYQRNFLRLDPSEDGSWARRTAHAGTDAADSDLTGLAVADLDGDGQSELVAAMGPWQAYDLRVLRPDARGELELIARRSIGNLPRLAVLRDPDGDLLAVVKDDQFPPGKHRFPGDRPLGEPAGVHFAGLRDGELQLLGSIPATTPGAPPRTHGRLFAGDLDGDGRDELIAAGNRGLTLVRWRDGVASRPLDLAGLTPIAAVDVDADGRAEIVATSDGDAPRCFLLGAGDQPLPLAPQDRAVPRPVAPDLDDPALASAWTRAEHLAAIGLPRRSADELAALASLSGPAAPDVWMRTAELEEAIGEDTRAATHYLAAATRRSLAPAALAGAARARRRLADFAAAADLQRARLRLHGEPPAARAAAAAELEALLEATAPRPELQLRFDAPLDPRWQVHDPLGFQRDLASGALSLWSSPTGVLAELPLEWDGGPATLEVELETDRLEWGNRLEVAVMGPTQDRVWLGVQLEAHGSTNAPALQARAVDGEDLALPMLPVAAGAPLRARVAVYPSVDTSVRELVIGAQGDRVVHPTSHPLQPSTPLPGQVRLRVYFGINSPGYVGHVSLKSLRLIGFTAVASPAAAGVDPASLLAEREYTAALAALADVPAGSERQLWRVDALAGLGRFDDLTGELRGFLAASHADAPLDRSLYHRLRRADPPIVPAAREALGARYVELLAGPMLGVSSRPEDLVDVLERWRELPATAPEDPGARRRHVLQLYLRGRAASHAGRRERARADLIAALAILDGASIGEDPAPTRMLVLNGLLELARSAADRPEVLRWLRVQRATSPTPELLLERRRADPLLDALLTPADWADLARP